MNRQNKLWTLLRKEAQDLADASEDQIVEKLSDLISTTVAMTEKKMLDGEKIMELTEDKLKTINKKKTNEAE
jgi:hypothetical protein